jgi:hypothetical protein
MNKVTRIVVVIVGSVAGYAEDDFSGVGGERSSRIFRLLAGACACTRSGVGHVLIAVFRAPEVG